MKEVQGVIENNILKLKLSGHIDSNNSNAVQEEINLIQGSSEVDKIQIDAGDLQYISSAGLRVLLRLRKQTEDFHLINVNPEVFEILDMTGFTEMMKVEKAYRQVSIEGCEVIGHGSNGTLYRIDHDNVVKVYKNEDALADIQHEREVARIALILGIPTAISYDVVKVGTHYGSVFELLDARPFVKILVDEPDKRDWCVKEFSGMLSRIHSTVVPHGKLPDMKTTVLDWVDFMKDHLPQQYWIKLKKLVVSVPDDDHMIHGDYHLKNLVLQGDDILLIDMDTLAVGNAIFELGSMYNAFAGFSELDHEVIKNFLGIDRETALDFWHRTLASYMGTSDPDIIKEVEDKARIIGYVRLIRRSIRRKKYETEKGRLEIELWKSNLLNLLDNVDTLLFYRNQILVEAREQKLPDVTGFIDNHLEREGCDPKTRKKIEMACEEVFTNICMYAYRNVTGTANISITVSDVQNPEFRKKAVITFTDSGVRFDPLAKPDPDITLNTQERDIGGLGIFLVKKTMDDVSYERCGDKNILTITKFF